MAGNKTRDAETDQLLGAKGWHVIRVWEHEEPTEAAALVVEAVRARTPAV